MSRYERQKFLVSQEKLKSATVLIAGTGGLGGSIGINLALAGVGNLILVDHDVVEESNLNRQVLYRASDIGKKKVYLAAERLKEMNPEIKVVPVDEIINENFDIPYPVDIVVDALDNLESRFNLEKFALNRGIPYVFGAVEGYMGMVTFIDKYTKKLKNFLPRDGNKKVQVLGATASFTAALQSLEVLKYLSGRGEVLRNNLLIYDALSTSFLEVKL